MTQTDHPKIDKINNLLLIKIFVIRNGTKLPLLRSFMEQFQNVIKLYMSSLFHIILLPQALNRVY